MKKNYSSCHGNLMQWTSLQNKQNTLCFLKLQRTSHLTFLSKLRFLQCQCVGENMRKCYPASIPKRACQMFHHQLKQLLFVFLKRDSPADWKERGRGRGNWCPSLRLLGLPCFSLETATCHYASGGWQLSTVPMVHDDHSCPTSNII